jgi:replicative DNA helicase
MRPQTTPSIASSSAAYDRELPHDLTAERALLGAMLLEQGAIGEAIHILKDIGRDAFYAERHGKLYEQITQMFDASKPLDSVVFADQLQQQGLLEELGGVQFLGELVGAVPAPERAEYYARLVRDKYLLRKLIAASHRVVNLALDHRQAVDEILDEAEQAIFNVTEQRVDESAKDIFAIVQEVFEQIESQESASTRGVATGFFELDEMTSGLQPGELIIVAGRPSMGKTAFGLNMAEHMAIVDRNPVLFFSLEMSKQQLANRVLCSRARVDAHKLRRGMLSPEDLRRLQAAADETRDAPLFVDDTSSLPVLALRARARTQFRKTPFKAIFVDYLQLMRGPRSESRQVEVAEISRGLKALSKELSVPVIALAQLNRGVEDRGGNRPRMSDLRESGAIEQDADLIGLLHREAYYRDPGGVDFEDPDANLAELIIAKQRNGPVGTVRLHFNRQWTRFDNHAPGVPGAGDGFG